MAAKDATARARTRAARNAGPTLAETGGAADVMVQEKQLADDFSANFALSPATTSRLHRPIVRTGDSRLRYVDLKQEYAGLWNEMAIRRERIAEADTIIARIVSAMDRYRTIEHATGVPWYVVGVIHLLEASGRFDRHLHNGDPLTARTVQVPAGRPRSGTPPFSWEESAIDALHYDGLAGNTD